VSSPFLPLSPCIFISSNGALEVEVGELQHAGHGAAVVKPPAVLCRLGFFSFSAKSDLIRRFLIQRPRSTDTPSLPIFQIRPYNYSRFNPQSKARFQISFSLYKSVFWFGFIEIRFQLFTVLPFNLF